MKEKNQKIEGLEHKLVLQNWLESERGWGIRPDVISVHLSEEDRIKYIKTYWDRMPDKVPDEYSRPVGDAKMIRATETLYELLLKNSEVDKGCGLRADKISVYQTPAGEAYGAPQNKETYKKIREERG